MSIFRKPYFLLIFTWSAFFLLPVRALDYGLFNSSTVEIWAAMGWQFTDFCWIGFAFFTFLATARLKPKQVLAGSFLLVYHQEVILTIRNISLSLFQLLIFL